MVGRRFLIERVLFVAIVIAMVSVPVPGLALAAPAEKTARPEGSTAPLKAADLFAIGKNAGQHFEPGPFGVQAAVGRVVAFEDHKYFAYVQGNVSTATGKDRQTKCTCSMARRFFFLKPSVFVIDDLVRVPDAKRPAVWQLQVPGPLATTGRQVRIAGKDGSLAVQTLSPKKASLGCVARPGADGKPAVHVVEVAPPDKAAEARFLHVFRAIGSGEESPSPAKLVDKNGVLQLTVSTKERTYQLTLPADRRAAGSIAVAKPDGQPLTVRRPLPSGVLPHGQQGIGLLERWDSAYHDNRRPGWDVGRPATNLKKAVEGGTIRPGRAVVLGCGTGTNAIYLAKRGFDVTGIDLAPTALSRAEEKARKAGVKVRWLVADVLKPPQLEPFDFVFDRGCYHGVRRHDAAGYVESVRRLSHKGTHLLILAGNANEPRHYGPPRVKEEAIRGDFSKSFEFKWLKQTRFDSRDPKREGPWAWSILLRRK